MAKIKLTSLLLKFITSIILFTITCYLFVSYQRKDYGGYVDLNNCIENSIIVNTFSEYKGILYINDSIIIEATYNNKKQPIVSLYEILEKQDSLFIKKNSDTIYHFRNGEKRWFIYYGEKCNENEGLNKFERLLKHIMG